MRVGSAPLGSSPPLMREARRPPLLFGLLSAFFVFLSLCFLCSLAGLVWRVRVRLSREGKEEDDGTEGWV